MNEIVNNWQFKIVENKLYMIVCHFCLNWPGFCNLNWNGPRLHRFHGLENLLIYVGDLNRFFTHREALCILQNALYFINHEIVNDASDDPCRRGISEIGCLLLFSYSFPFLFTNILICVRKLVIILRMTVSCGANNTQEKQRRPS